MRAPRPVSPRMSIVARLVSSTLARRPRVPRFIAREALADRIDDQDPAYADAFVQSLSRLAAVTRTALHAL